MARSTYLSAHHNENQISFLRLLEENEYFEVVAFPIEIFGIVEVNGVFEDRSQRIGRRGINCGSACRFPGQSRR